MSTIVGFFILLAFMFYGFEVFWLRTNEHLKNDNIHNDVAHNDHSFYSHGGMGRE